MHNTRQLFLFSWRYSSTPGRSAADRVGRSSAESSPRKPDGEGTGLAVWTKHCKQMEALSICVALLLEDMRWLGGKTGDSAGGKKQLQAASGILSLIPDNSTASGAGLLSWPEMLSRWGGTGAIPRENIARQVSQEKRG